MRALPPRSAPASNRRQTMDPRAVRDSTDSKPSRRSVMPPSLSKRFTSREKLPAKYVIPTDLGVCLDKR